MFENGGWKYFPLAMFPKVLTVNQGILYLCLVSLVASYASAFNTLGPRSNLFSLS